ncbi:peptidoglycan bridge formation glycyltransferase FemA/FemB family protein [Patescibacteria group bacterium]|nr:peptidoglycan bridge formation glycyltransferase FemA/FemB family protein [Patescibacteria group bacterium]MBU4458389.1 peptidoglycan bridge formation glycyltransferase FemA/FemB family protein [Patescibacteria group bacterium]MCG2695856.1 peptidoglycan bridge formation glycyltransferase FemA/FemB family protein [Candidatus Portnoybacteria bacterium]
MGNFQELNKPEFKALLDKTLFKTFFHSIEWHEFLEKEFKWLKFEYYLYKYDEAILVFGRIKTCLSTGMEKLISLPFCEYGGPLPLKGSIMWEEFTRDIFKEFGDNIKIKIHPRISEILGNPRSSSNLSSYWLYLENKSEQEIWESLRKTLRQEIRNAKEQGLEIRAYKNPKELKKFYDLYAANLRQKKTIPYPWPLIQFLCQNPSSELLLASYRGKIVGGALFLKYSSPRGEAGGFIHYFLSASDYKYHNFGIAHLILWEKIKGLIGKNITLDLGASPQGSDLEIFKRGWGGTEWPIYQIGIKRTEESFRSSKIIRFIWGLLPNFIIKKLSPYLIKYRL